VQDLEAVTNMASDATPLNVLIISCYDLFPTNDGGLIRILNLAKALSTESSIRQVTLLYPSQRADAEKDQSLYGSLCLLLKPTVPSSLDRLRFYRLISGLVRGLPPFVTGTYYSVVSKACAELLTHEKFDVIQLERVTAAAYTNVIRRYSKGSIVVDLHDIETYRFQTAGRPRSRKSVVGYLFYILDRLMVQSWERKAIEQADAVCVVSSEEHKRLLELVPTYNGSSKVCVIPNGTILFPEALSLGEALVMVGSLHYDPNYEAARWMVKSVMPYLWKSRPETKLIIAGSASPNFSTTELAIDDRVTVLLNVDDILDVYRQAFVAIIGVKSGGGTALKLLEALALGIPVVSTSFGVRGYTERPPCLIGDTSLQMAEQILRLLNDPEERDRLARLGRNFVSQGYLWQVLGQKLATFYQNSLTT
jgi:glycosyltransferase involved in cell wall biosynthesis